MMHGQKNIKLRSNMFRSHSDHPQGACIFLIKIIDFKIC